MKAITIHQPWASLIAHGYKRFETRGWRTNYRGPIAIHAGLQTDWRSVQMIQHNYPAIWLKIYTLPTGRILAIAELTECWKSLDGKLIEAQSPGEKRVRFADTHELYFGDFTPGRYAWELTNVRRLPEPIPARGQQGLWNWEPPEGVTVE